MVEFADYIPRAPCFGVNLRLSGPICGRPPRRSVYNGGDPSMGQYPAYNMWTAFNFGLKDWRLRLAGNGRGTLWDGVSLQ